MKLFRIFALVLALCSPAMATVSSTINTITYTGNSATTNFSFNFSYPGAASSAASDFTVTIVVSGVTTVLPTNSYTITFNAPVSPNPTGIGGSVLYPLIGSPLATGATITITRTLPAIQTVSLSNQGILYPPTLEAEYDYLTMLMQQALNEFGRVVIAPLTDPAGLNYTLPAAASRAGLLSCFDSSGNVTACSVLPQGTVSSVMQPVINAASLALGRTAFGLGTAATQSYNCGLGADSAVGNLDVNFTTVQVATNQAISAANCSAIYIATGPITFTLPRANTLWNGFGFWVHTLSGGITTLSPNAADTIESVTSGTSVSLPIGSWAWIVTDAAASGNWRVQISYELGSVPMAVGPANLYVNSATGSDSNTCLGSGVACKTIQNAVNLATQSVSYAGTGPTINVADGTYTEQVSCTQPVVGAPGLTIVGDVATPTNVIWTPPNTLVGLLVNNGCNVTMSGVYFT